MDLECFPESLKKNAFEVGQVLEMEMGLSDNISPKKGRESKLKRFVVIAKDDDTMMLASLIINSKINRNEFAKIFKYQLKIYARENDYLEHDSYIDGYLIREFPVSRLEHTAKYLGKMKEEDLKKCLEKVQSSPAIKPYLLIKYGLQPASSEF